MFNLKIILVATVGSAGVALGTVNAANAVTFVSPNDLANTEGDIAASISNNTTSSGRFQQVFAASQFVPGSQYITKIAFRPDGSTGTPFTETFPSINISFSTTTASPTNLSSTVDQNVGGDKQVVVSGPLSLSSSNVGAVGQPKNFDVLINLNTPFLYNSALGNLLYDVTFSAPTGVIGSDFVDTTSSSPFVSSVSSAFTGSTVNGTAVPGVGVVTQFTTTPVPEPSSTLGLLAFATLGAGSLLTRKLQKSK